MSQDKAPAAAKKLISFKSPSDFRTWLAKNHAQTEGIWLRIFKKDSGVESVNYSQALDQALCFGWIDGLKLPHDEKSWIQKFTPRRARSPWSKRNTEHVERLIKSGEMTAAGMRVVEAARADGRWAQAYDSSGSAQPPPDFLSELTKDKKTKAFFESLNRANVYAIAYRLQTARKPETRERRMKAILQMLKRGEKFH